MNDIYLDNSATSEPWPEVVEAVCAAMKDFGNASSLHRSGLAAARRIEEATGYIRALCGSDHWNVVYTSGASESDTMAVFGSVPKGRRNEMVTTHLEHPAITEAATEMQSRGVVVSRVGGGPGGVIVPVEVGSAVNDRTALVSMTHVSGELGTVQPVNETAVLVKKINPNCRFHVDAVQAAARLPRLDYAPQVDMISLSAHKIHGPQGVGALLLRKDTVVRPLIFGGDQQGGLRPGTLNLPGIVGFGMAARLMTERRGEAVAAMARRARRLAGGISETCTGVRVLGDPERGASGIVVLAVAGVKPQVLLHALEDRGVTASSGSACHSRRSEPAQCLTDAGLKRDEGVLRLSMSTDTNDEQIEAAIVAMGSALGAVRGGTVGRVGGQG